jgi:predicted cobalt transporter CbtA
MAKEKWFIPPIICLVLFAMPIYACPFCQETLSAAKSGLAQGFFWSILLMVAMPFAVAGVIGALIVRGFRQASKRPRLPSPTFPVR